MVALAILAFGLYGAADLVASARHTSSLTHKRMQATALAQLKLQELRCARENLPPLFSNGAREIVLPATGTEVFEQNSRYSWKAHLTLQDAPQPGISVMVQVGAGPDLSSTSTLAQVQGTVYLPPVAGAAKVL